VGVEVGGARGMSMGVSVPGIHALVGVGALPHSTRGVLGLGLSLFICDRGATRVCKSPWMTLNIYQESTLPRSNAVNPCGRP